MSLTVNLANKHITDRKLPDKAIDVIDEVGAYARITHKPSVDDVYTIKSEDIEKIVAKIARIPEKTISVNEKDKIKYLERDLKLLIYGQDEAVDKVSNAIILSRSGLGNQNKPIASFIFAGPTGCWEDRTCETIGANHGN